MGQCPGTLADRGWIPGQDGDMQGGTRGRGSRHHLAPRQHRVDPVLGAEELRRGPSGCEKSNLAVGRTAGGKESIPLPAGAPVPKVEGRTLPESPALVPGRRTPRSRPSLSMTAGISAKLCYKESLGKQRIPRKSKERMWKVMMSQGGREAEAGPGELARDRPPSLCPPEGDTVGVTFLEGCWLLKTHVVRDR